jgi:hypothetical protein
MSFAATPATGPVRVADNDVDAALNMLGVALADPRPDEVPAGSPDADPGDDQQATSEPQTENPIAGDDQAEEADPNHDSEGPEDPVVTVKVRGEDRQIPLSEALKGYSRTEDYKAKTAEIAEQRKALDATKADLSARMAQLDAVLAQAPQDPILSAEVNTDWPKLAQEDPAGYVARRAQFEARLASFQQVQMARANMQQQAFAQEWQRTEQELARDLPEWRTEDGKRDAKARVVKTLRAAGIPDQTIATIADPGIIRLVLDAAAHRDALNARQSAETKRAPTPAPTRVLRPGTAVKPAPNRALLNQARSGPLDQSVDAVMRLLG